MNNKMIHEKPLVVETFEREWLEKCKIRLLHTYLFKADFLSLNDAPVLNLHFGSLKDEEDMLLKFWNFTQAQIEEGVNGTYQIFSKNRPYNLKGARLIGIVVSNGPATNDKSLLFEFEQRQDLKIVRKNLRVWNSEKVYLMYH